MFRGRKVAYVDLVRITGDAAASQPTYSEVGATLSGTLPSGYQHLRFQRFLGSDEHTFDRAVLGLRTWETHTGAGLVVAPARPPELGITVAVAAPLGPLTAIAICRVVAVVDEPDRFGYAYGTLPGHPERGEEAFIVSRNAEGEVMFDVIAFSRPAELLARLGGPVSRQIQRQTTQKYLDGLAKFVNRASA